MREGDRPIEKSRYGPEQVAFGFRQAEEGTPVAEVCRKMGVSVSAKFLNVAVENVPPAGTTRSNASSSLWCMRIRKDRFRTSCAPRITYR